MFLFLSANELVIRKVISIGHFVFQNRVPHGRRSDRKCWKKAERPCNYKFMEND